MARIDLSWFRKQSLKLGMDHTLKVFVLGVMVVLFLFIRLIMSRFDTDQPEP